MDDILNLLKPYFDFSLIETAAISVFVLLFGIQIFYYSVIYRKILSFKDRLNKGKVKVDYVAEAPSVSVIICSMNDSENLKRCLPGVLEQDYPNFEVIIVNDSFTIECQTLVNEYQKKYSNLYSTYIPEGAKFLSRKKLAVTVAAKAARNDILLFTEPDCHPETVNWISKIMRNFTPDTGIVLGYCRYEKTTGHKNRLASFDNLFSAIQYLGYAIDKRPYKAVGRNLAYRKKIFFENKGFAKHLFLQIGEDDLFINEIAGKEKVRVELSFESIPACRFTKYNWESKKMNEALTSKFYPKSISWLFGFETFTRYLFYAGFFGIVALSGLNIFLWTLAVIAALFFGIRFYIQSSVINNTAKILNEQHFYVSLLYFDLILPVINLFYKLYRKFGGKKDYTYHYKY